MGSEPTEPIPQRSLYSDSGSTVLKGPLGYEWLSRLPKVSFWIPLSRVLCDLDSKKPSLLQQSGHLTFVWCEGAGG